MKRGLPVRSDGKLDREQALRWIKSHIYFQLGSHGSTRARQLIRDGFAGPDYSDRLLEDEDLEHVVLDERELARGG